LPILQKYDRIYILVDLLTGFTQEPIPRSEVTTPAL
jgi:hypothetical protein